VNGGNNQPGATASRNRPTSNRQSANPWLCRRLSNARSVRSDC